MKLQVQVWSGEHVRWWVNWRVWTAVLPRLWSWYLTGHFTLLLNGKLLFHSLPEQGLLHWSDFPWMNLGEDKN